MDAQQDKYSYDGIPKMASTENQLHWADYLVFVSVLLISLAIGLVNAFRSRNQTDDDLLLGRRQLPMIPVIFSLSVSFVSAVSVLGIPAEFYINGIDYLMIACGFIWPLVVIAIFILPLIYKLNLTSAYEYLELRFNKTVRLAGSFTFIFLMICYMAVVLYAPALALSQVAGLSMEVSILTVGLICTFYTSIGGIRAVVWTDVFQTLVITIGMCTLIGLGASEVGGLTAVLDKIKNTTIERKTLWSFDPDPFVRHTFWTLTVGGGLGMMALYAANQAILQRYLMVDSLKKSRMVLLINIPLAEFYLCLLCLMGLVMYAYYLGRDPIKQGRIQKRDQLLPLFVMDIFGDLPGLPGLFIATVFSAALSTVSSGVNSLAAVATEDLIKPLWTRYRSEPSPNTLKKIIMATAILFGLLTIGAAYLSGLLSQTLLIMVVMVLGMIGGPLLGLMLMGILCPWVNSVGAVSGLVVSLVINTWVTVGQITKPWPMPSSSNSTLANATSLPQTEDKNGFSLNDWYSLSYQHLPTLAVLVTFVVGTLMSLVTGCNKGRKLNPETYHDTLRPCRRNDEYSVGNGRQYTMGQDTKV